MRVGGDGGNIAIKSCPVNAGGFDCFIELFDESRFREVGEDGEVGESKSRSGECHSGALVKIRKRKRSLRTT